jgi:hypothetical protein
VRGTLSGISGLLESEKMKWETAVLTCQCSSLVRGRMWSNTLTQTTSNKNQTNQKEKITTFLWVPRFTHSIINKEREHSSKNGGNWKQKEKRERFSECAFLIREFHASN